jgi:two-component system chemotaxis sensor kinase CheA
MTIMGEEYEPLVERVDDLLNRAACEVVLSGKKAERVVRGLLGKIVVTLKKCAVAGLDDMLRQVEQVSADDASALPGRLAHIEAAWNTWKVARVAEAGSSDAPAPVQIPVPPSAVLLEVDVASADRIQTDAAAANELVMLVDDPELAGMFIAEAVDHLSSIEALVLQVEVDPDDTKLLNDIFRPFHTIKGNAGALGVTSVQELAHVVESLLDLGRSGEHHIGAVEIELILKSVDLLTTMIQGLRVRIAGQPGPDVREECLSLIQEVQQVIASPGSVRNTTGAPTADAAIQAEIAALAQLTAEVTPTHASTEPSLSAARGVGPRPAMQGEGSLQTIKVETRKLDNLVDIVGELVIAQSIIQEDPALCRVVDERLTRNLAQLKRITTDLQRNAMSMRMTPVRPTFQKMSRLVRDLSTKSGKNIELVLAGEDTELDRKVVEDINDPLMHMVRNSIDHGIESPEVRRSAGKPAQARVSLSAYHEGGAIVISIADDGAGLNTERIRAKAIAQGVIREDAGLSTAEIHELIFAAGFTTAEKVTEISGRGGGMDVVRRNIEALRGRIEIHSTPGLGTTFNIKLPLTLAIVEGLLLRTGQQRFVLPTFCIRESLRPTPEQVHSFQGRRRVIQVRDSLLPMIHLAELFGETGPLPEPWEATVVVIEDNGRHVALTVDELLGKQEVVIKSLGNAFANVQGVAGAAILGDGRVGLILDAGGLLALMDKPLKQAA